MLRLPRLALALALLAAPAAAQSHELQFPNNGGHIRSEMTIPMTWEGRPALLVMGSWNVLRVSYAWQDPFHNLPAKLTPVFSLRGVLAVDPRPCYGLPGAGRDGYHLILEDGVDSRSWFRFTTALIGAGGYAEWMGTYPIAFQKNYSTTRPTQYRISYCDYSWHAERCGPCNGPPFVAMLLVYEGMDW